MYAIKNVLNGKYSSKHSFPGFVKSLKQAEIFESKADAKFELKMLEENTKEETVLQVIELNVTEAK